MKGFLQILGFLNILGGLITGIATEGWISFIIWVSAGIIGSSIFFGIAKIIDNQEVIIEKLNNTLGVKTQGGKLYAYKKCTKCNNKIEESYTSCPKCANREFE